MTRKYRSSGIKNKRFRKDGYVDVWCPDHPIARKDGYVFEHRKIAWDAGMFDDKTLEVHHINGIKTDNRIENFQILSKSEHASSHASIGSTIKNQYGTFVVGTGIGRSWRLNRESILSHGRRCRVCGDEIHEHKRSDALYCGSKCRMNAFNERHRN